MNTKEIQEAIAKFDMGLCGQEVSRLLDLLDGMNENIANLEAEVKRLERLRTLVMTNHNP